MGKIKLKGIKKLNKALNRSPEEFLDDVIKKQGIEITCAHCNTKFNAKSRVCKCPVCGTEITINL